MTSPSRNGWAASRMSLGMPKNAAATAPAMQAMESLSPPMEMALRTASSKLSASKKASMAWGTLPAQETSN